MKIFQFKIGKRSHQKLNKIKKFGKEHWSPSPVFLSARVKK